MNDRQKLVNAAASYIGCKEADDSHRQIIDIYNGHKPLARGYAVKYTDAWCATFVSAMAIKCGLTDVIPTECGCGQMVQLFQKLGTWQENDAHVPQPGDIIFYDWDDSGVGDNTGWPDHVGIVESVNGSDIKVIEGNMNDAVGRRTLKVNGRYIRGYGAPAYKGGSASGSYAGTGSPVPSAGSSLAFNVGDAVQFAGGPHYISANASKPSGNPKAGPAKVTAISKGAKHPYHVVHTNGQSSVYGWVDADKVSK